MDNLADRLTTMSVAELRALREGIMREIATRSATGRSR